MRHFDRVDRSAVGTIALVAIASIAAWFGGLRINMSTSIPLGVYLKAAVPAAIGDLVLVCPPAREPFLEAYKRGYLAFGPCPSGVSPLMKRLEAGPGESLIIDATGVRVNGRLVPQSAPLAVDGRGRPMPILDLSAREIPAGKVLLMGVNSGSSFDSRYFGLIEQVQIQAVLKPVYTWDGK